VAVPQITPSTPLLSSRPRFEMPPELVPEIGKIGAEVGLLISGSASPFGLNRGTFQGGFIDLPAAGRQARLAARQDFLRIVVHVTQSRSTFNTTSNVAQVANLTVLNALNPTGGLQNVSAALTGTGAAPFPVTNSTETRLSVLQVVPFSLKYTSSALDRWRIRPDGVLGLGVFVTIHNQNPARGTPAIFGVRPDAQLPPEILAIVKQTFGGQAPFGGRLVAGQISQSPELEQRGLPGGHGNLDIGLHTGYGLEYRLMRSLSQASMAARTKSPEQMADSDLGHPNRNQLLVHNCITQSQHHRTTTEGRAPRAGARATKTSLSRSALYAR
jgi:hypothetical protein